MRKIVIIGIILIITLTITGCGNKEVTENSTINTENTCNSPYFEYKTGECCLDKDSNNICDSDEETKEEVTVPVKEKEETKTLTTQPVQALTVESCTDTSYFDCTWSYITKDEIQFKLKATKAGVAVIKKIEAPNIPCVKDFEDGSIENGMKFGDERQINMKCDFRKDSVESDLNIHITYYDKKGFKDQNVSKQWMGYSDPGEITNKGWISGMVR